MISQYIQKMAQEKKARVAIGLTNVTDGIVNSLNRAQQYADITIVGTRVSNHKNISVDLNSENAQKEIAVIMASLLKNNDVDAIVRGNVSASAVIAELATALGHEKILRVAIVRDVKEREFLLTPASVTEGNTMSERLHMIRGAATFLHGLGVEPRVAIGQIENVRRRSEAIAQSMDEADFIAEALRRDSVAVPFIGYTLEKAVDTCNIIAPPSGIIGNAIWRTITGIGGCVDLGDFGLIDEPFVDDSQYWDDYFQPIIFAVALANIKTINRK